MKGLIDVTRLFREAMISGIVIHSLIIMLTVFGARLGILSYSNYAGQHYKRGLCIFFFLRGCAVAQLVYAVYLRFLDPAGVTCAGGHLKSTDDISPDMRPYYDIRAGWAMMIMPVM